MTSMDLLRLHFGALLLLSHFITATFGAACLEMQSQSVKHVQFSKNIRRDNVIVSVALNCCPNDNCCSPGVFDSGAVLQHNGRCMNKALIETAQNALSCLDNETPNLPAHQRRATITGVKNGFSLRCLYSDENDRIYDERETVNIKVLPQIIHFGKEVVEQPERGILLTCKAALGSYTADYVDLSFTNETSTSQSRQRAVIGTTKWDEKITRELTGANKDIANYLKSELNLSATYEVELKHFIPDKLIYWKDLNIACHLKLADKAERVDKIEFDNTDKSKKIMTLKEGNIQTLPKVEVAYDDFSKRVRCSVYSYPKLSTMKWSFAVGRGQNFSEIPTENITTAVTNGDWTVSYYNGPFDSESVYQCDATNSVGSTTGELEITTTTSTTPATTTMVKGLVEDEGFWDPSQGPPSQLDSQFPFYWVIVIVGILIIFAVAIAVILHLRKRGTEYKSGKRGGEAADDEEQQRLQDNSGGKAAEKEAPAAPTDKSPEVV